MDEEFTLNVKGFDIKGVLENKESKKLMILLHGFTGDMHGPGNSFIKLSEQLQENGYAVLRFNFRGTPPSGMEFKDMTVQTETDDFKAALSFAESHGFKKIGVLGESFGAMIAVNGYDHLVDVLILWYPCFDLTDDSLFRLVNTQEAQKSLKERGYIELYDGFRIGLNHVKEIKEFKVYDRFEKIICPVQFIHGDKDTIDPVHQSQKAFELVNETKELQIIKGVGHCFRQNENDHGSKVLTKEQQDAIDLAINFLKKYF
jgi:uncharacterized protein